MTGPVTRLLWPIASLVVLLYAAGCGTEPSDDVPGGYRLVAADDGSAGRIACFASTARYEAGGLVDQGECDVELRTYTARLDSAGPIPELVLAAEVVREGGITDTWAVRVPTRIRNSTIEYDFTTVTEPFTAEQVFILPLGGTLANGVLTLLMPTFSSSGLPDRTEYLRPAPSIFVLTITGRPPASPALAGRYVGDAFAGTPAEQCDTEVPSRCFHRTFTLSSAGQAWMALYDEVVTAGQDTLGGRSLEAGNLRLTRTNGFVRITDDEPPISVLHFEAKGALAGSTLTLFPTFSFLDGGVLRARSSPERGREYHRWAVDESGRRGSTSRVEVHLRRGDSCATRC